MGNYFQQRFDYTNYMKPLIIAKRNTMISALLRTEALHYYPVNHCKLSNSINTVFMGNFLTSMRGSLPKKGLGTSKLILRGQNSD